MLETRLKFDPKRILQQVQTTDHSSPIAYNMTYYSMYITQLTGTLTLSFYGESNSTGRHLCRSLPGIPQMPRLPKAQAWKAHPHFHRGVSSCLQDPLRSGTWTLFSQSHFRIQACVSNNLFSRWVEAFPCRRGTASAVSKRLPQTSFPLGEPCQSPIGSR